MGFHEGWWSCGRFLINHLGEEIILHWQAMWCMDTFVHMHTWRFSSVIHEMYGCKWVDSVSGCVRGAYRGGEGRVKVRRREVSFICIWHTSLLCYSDSTIILITVCLPLPPPPPPPHPFLLLFLLTRKMMYLQKDLQHFQHFSFQASYEKVLFVQVLGFLFWVLSRSNIWKSNLFLLACV